MIREFLRDEAGATAIEYGLIVTMIGLACVLAFEALGEAVVVALERVSAELSAAR